MVPPPDYPHGDIDARLNRSLIAFMLAHNIAGEVHHPREAVWIDGTYVEPDMMYVSHELRASMGERRTSADIVFEYLSPSTANYDRTTKADTYLALGVRELLVIDLARVGSGSGPSLGAVAQLASALPGLAIYAGGGVRDDDDLSALESAGAAGALVATALHQGHVTPRQAPRTTAPPA